MTELEHLFCIICMVQHLKWNEKIITLSKREIMYMRTILNEKGQQSAPQFRRKG